MEHSLRSAILLCGDVMMYETCALSLLLLQKHPRAASVRVAQGLCFVLPQRRMPSSRFRTRQFGFREVMQKAHVRQVTDDISGTADRFIQEA